MGTFRPEVLEILQFGKESTAAYATPVPANKRLGTIMGDLQPRIPVTRVMSRGSKSPVAVVVAKEHTEMPITGEAALNDLAYLFAMLLKEPDITTPVGATTARLFEYLPDTHGPDTLQSFTVEQGSSLGAARMAGVLCNSLDLTFTPEKSVDFRGDLFGKVREGDVTLTPTPTKVEQVMLDPRGVDVFLATDEAGLATDQIFPLQAMFRVTDRLQRVFTLDSAEPSFENVVEKALLPAGQLIVRVDTDSEGYIDSLRNHDLLFLRLKWTGALIEATTHYSLEIDFPFSFENPAEGATQEAHTHTFDLCGIDDDTFGASCRVRITTTMTAL